MNELITTLENRSDLEQLAQSAVDTILLYMDGVSSSSADKLSMDELRDAKTLLAGKGKKIAVSANLTLHEDEIEKAEAAVAFLAELNVDTIFYEDPAMYALAKKHGVVDRLIYDPETLMTSINDASWWLNRGIKGIAISPLLTLEETVEIAKTVKQAVVTVHGRTIMSRSYRKLLSTYAEHNHLKDQVSRNRQMSVIETSREGTMPIYEDETGTLIYSDNVLDSFDFIGRILDSEPMAILVEGSYLALEEQLEAIQAYRHILNGEDPSAIGKEYRAKFHGEPLDSGYYEQKTVR